MNQRAPTGSARFNPLGLPRESFRIFSVPIARGTAVGIIDTATGGVVGGLTLKDLGTSYEVHSAAAVRGYGPLTYDAAATLLGKKLTPSVIQSHDAQRFWGRTLGVIAPLPASAWQMKYGVSFGQLLDRGELTDAQKRTAVYEAVTVADTATSRHKVARMPYETQLLGVGMRKPRKVAAAKEIDGSLVKWRKPSKARGNGRGARPNFSPKKRIDVDARKAPPSTWSAFFYDHGVPVPSDFEDMWDFHVEVQATTLEDALAQALAWFEKTQPAGNCFVSSLCVFSHLNPDDRGCMDINRAMDNMLRRARIGLGRGGPLVESNPGRASKRAHAPRKPRIQARRNPSGKDVGLYLDVLAYLRALQWLYWTTHWTAGGPNFYGTHLMLQRLYEGKGGPDINEQIDQLGERIVAYFGPNAIDAASLQGRSAQLIQRSGPQVLPALFSLEQQLQQAIKRAWTAEQAAGDARSLGLDDYLMGLANERDTAVYLLKRAMS